MLESFRLVFDTGLLVLIWMVQLIAYPSFKFFTGADLFPWHKKYVSRIAAIVIPLMFGQLICAALQLYQKQSFYEILSAFLIAAVWVITFMTFVGLHDNVSNRKQVETSVSQLITKNWIRTFLWTLVFLLTISYKIKPLLF